MTAVWIAAGLAAYLWLACAIGRRLKTNTHPVVAKWDATDWWHGYQRHLSANASDALARVEQAEADR